MVLGNTSVQEIMNDPDPGERKRDLDVPAFLKPSAEIHRLSALITIYHEIPLIREAFLPRTSLDAVPDYGSDKEWWSGRAIDVPGVFGPDVSLPDEVTLELHRLMAFLDKTERSYGSVEPLANLNGVRLQENQRTKEAAFLTAWKSSVQQSDPSKVSRTEGLLWSLPYPES